MEKEKDEFLLKNEKFKANIEAYKEKALNTSIKQFLTQTKHINIILLGKTGVGKSTLINTQTGRNDAQEGGYKSVTSKISFYEDKSGHLRLYDTVGIELTEHRNAEKILEEVQKTIDISEKKIQIGLFIVFGIVLVDVVLKKKKKEQLLKNYQKHIKMDKCLLLLLIYKLLIKKR